MPRNSTGKYFLPDGNPVADGELITAEWANSTLSDIATAITDSLDREGLGGMNAPLEVADGSLSKPGMNFTNESNTGLYRPAAKTVGVAVGGVEVATVTQSGMQLKAGKQLVIPQAPVDSNDAANKTYVDTAASNAQSNAESYAASQASGALTSAKTYADTAASGALTSAKTYADGVASTAQSNAESYADSKASTAQSNAESNAESYANEKFAPKNSPVITGDTIIDNGPDNNITIRRPTGYITFGTSSGSTILFGPKGGVTIATGGIEASWGSGGDPQIGVALTRDVYQCGMLFRYGGQIQFRGSGGGTLFTLGGGNAYFANTGASGFSGQPITTPDNSVANAVTKNGYIQWTVSGTTQVGTNFFVSDINKKTDIKASSVWATDSIRQIEFIEFTWKEEAPDEGTVEVGFSAQQLEGINKGFVRHMSDDSLMLHEPTMLPYITKALQEQIHANEALQAEVQSLKSDVADLKAAVQALKGAP